MVQQQICKLLSKKGHLEFASTGDAYGKLDPKNGDSYQIVITVDNPDIQSLVTEKRLAEQACKELEKQIGYGLKIWHQFEYPDPINTADARISFVSTDPYFTENVLAYAGYPSGSLRGIVVFNNKFPWLDGYQRTGAQLRALGIILPNMIDNQLYATFNFKQTLKHELCGHAFGLPHTLDDTDVMNAYYRTDRLMFGQESKDLLNLKYGKAGIGKRFVPDAYIKSVMKRKL